MISSRKFRIFLVVFLFGSVLYLLYPRAVGFVSTNAFVNAPVISVRVPFEGIIEAPSKPRAAGLKAGDPLLEFQARRGSRLELALMESRLETLRQRLVALDAQIADFSDLRQNYDARFLDEQGLASDHVATRFAQALANQVAAEARLAQLVAQSDRARQLADRSIVADAQLRDLEFELSQAAADVDQAKAVVDMLQVERRAVQGHGLTGDGPTDVSYLGQRMDEIDIRIVDLNAERASVTGELTALQPVVTELQHTLKTVDHFRPAAPADSLIWRPSPGPSTTLIAGEEAMQILDCSRRFVEVTFRERHFGQIRQGSVAHVRLKGSDTVFTAPVSALRGVGNDRDTAGMSAIDRSRTAADLTLYLDIPAQDPTDARVASAFCDVGRTAEVRIQRQSLQDIMCRVGALMRRPCASSTAAAAETLSDDASRTVPGRSQGG